MLLQGCYTARNTLENEMKKLMLARSIIVIAMALGGSVAFALDLSLPQTQHTGSVSYLSGGIGLDQSGAIRDAMPDYPLVLTFVRKTANSGNEYLADVAVTIRNARGEIVLDMTSEGPYVLVSLPDGRYMVNVNYEGDAKQRSIVVSRAKHSRATFTWPM